MRFVGLKYNKRYNPPFTTSLKFSIIQIKTMEKGNGVFVIDLPNINNEDVLKLTEQLILQSEKMMDGYRIENKNLIIEILIKNDKG